jgi:5S rRNA maturation endonuclease (ribonuclease M5)
MDSRINVLQTMQSETFKKYSLKEEKHDAEVSEIRNNFVDLDSSVKSLRDEVKEHLNGLTNLLVNNSILIKNNHIDTVEELKVNKAAANKSKKTPESR